MNEQISYVIPMLPPSLNQFAGRKNQWNYRKAKAEWKGIVKTFCRPKPTKPLEKSIVRIIYYFPDHRRRDPDNYQKMLLDGLVTAGIIKDDDFAHCIPIPIGKCDPQNPRTEVEIIEIKET